MNRRSLTRALAGVMICALATPGTTTAGHALADIQALIGRAECSSGLQCRVVGVGARACGGPEAYWAWSTLQTSEKQLLARVERNAQDRRQALERTGQQSDCRVLVVPTAHCVYQDPPPALGRCVLESAPGSR